MFIVYFTVYTVKGKFVDFGLSVITYHGLSYPGPAEAMGDCPGDQHGRGTKLKIIFI